jgi:hypothetical protein
MGDQPVTNTKYQKECPEWDSNLLSQWSSAWMQGFSLVSWDGVRLNPLGTSTTEAYCTSRGWQIKMNVEQSVEWEVAGESEVLGKNLTQCHFVHHKSHMAWPGLEPGCRSEVQHCYLPSPRSRYARLRPLPWSVVGWPCMNARPSGAGMDLEGGSCDLFQDNISESV